MATENKLDTLVINYLTQDQFNTAQSNGTIDPNQLYLTPDGGIGAGLVNGANGVLKTNIRSENRLSNDSAAATEKAGRVYPVALDKSGYLAVNVPWENTTYSAGSGLSLSGTTFNHSNSVTAGTAGTSSATSGATLAVPYVTYDAQGHITATGTHTHTINSLSADVITGGYVNIHPENSPTLIPFIHNDIAHLLKRGGSVSATYDGNTVNYDFTNAFDGSGSYVSVSSSTYSTLVITVNLHKVFPWTNTIYIDFGAAAWRAKSIKIEVMNSNYTDDVWTQKYNTTNNGAGHVYVTFGHTPVGASNAGGGYNKIRFTLSNFNSTDRRIAQIGVYFYGSAGLRETYMSRGADDPIFRSITPYANNTYSLGSSSNKWSNVYATTLTGTLDGPVKDSGNGTNTTFAYSKAGLDSTSWFAAWNGYELRAISPAKTKSALSLSKSDVGLGNVLNFKQVTAIGQGANGTLRVWTGDPSSTSTNDYTDVAVTITAYEQSSVQKAEALNLSAAVGNTNKPVYFKADGKPYAINYTIDKSVPSDAKFTDTTYTAGSGLTLDGTQFKHSNSITAGTIADGGSTRTLGFGGTFKIPSITYDAQGHIKSTTTITLTMPTAPSSTTNATNDSDGNPINTTYIKKSIGTAAGDIIYWSASGTPTRLAKGSNGQVLKLANGVPTWGTDNNDNTWRGIQDNLTSSTNTTESLSAKQGYLLANGSARDNTKILLNTAGGIASVSGNGTNWYFKIATIKITSSYINRPIIFEISGRGKEFTLLQVIFQNINSSDPALGSFSTNNETSFWIKKSATSTWEIYGQYSEQWGSAVLHRITGAGADIGVTVNMTNEGTTAPTDATQVSYFGKVAYAANAGTVNGHTVGIDVPSTAKFTDTWNPLTTSQAGYVSTAPNDTAKFLRGDATWAQVSSANLSDIRLTWSSSVSTTDWILAHDTAATGTPLFRAMSPANLKTTMSLNNVENKSSATIRGELTSSNVTTALGYTPVNKAGDTMGGPLKWNSTSLPQFSGAPSYLVGIDAFASGGTMKWQEASQITVGAATKATQDKNGNDITTKYVTIDTDQTITASQKTFTGATRWGSASKYGAVHYDTSLEALVFSFL